MKINMQTKMVSFNNEEEEKNVEKKIFRAFLIKKDEELSHQWFNVKENKQEFYNVLADLWIARIFAIMAEKEGAHLFNQNILNEKDFMSKVKNCSVEVAKLAVVVLTAFENNNIKGKKDIKSSSLYKKLLSELKDLFVEKIDYDFRFDKKVKLPFIYK